MPDSKITALTSISTSTDPANDPLVIVDVSDTSMAATGTTKKVTLNQLLATSPTATLASATISGDLTVDTSTLKVVSASDVVGINTASPLTGTDAGLTIGAIGTVKALNIGLQNTFARLREKDAIDAFAITTNITASNTQDDATKSSWKARMGFGNGNDNFIISRSNVGGTTFYDLLAVSAGSCVWYDGAGGTRMTLNATGLGVGASPNHKLQAVGGYVASGRLGSASTGDIGGLLMYCSTDNGGRRSWGLKAESGLTGVLGFWLSSANNTEPFSGSQVMSLDASGSLLVGTTNNVIWNTTNQGCVVSPVAIQASRSNDVALLLNRIGSDGKTAVFARQGLEVGDISVTTTGTTYNSTSDYRLKEAVQPLSGGLSRVNALKPSVYKWKSNGFNGEGFLAHELAEVVPAAVSGEKDAVNEDGTIKAQSIDMSRVVPILVAAIQELTARVQTLEAK